MHFIGREADAFVFIQGSKEGDALALELRSTLLPLARPASTNLRAGSNSNHNAGSINRLGHAVRNNKNRNLEDGG
jgi:hypothetical protein